MKTISVTQLHERLAAGTITVVDVREDDELALARIDSAVHMPLHQLPQRFSELDPQAPIALLCHHGMRSEMAARFLEKNGYGDIANISGGTDAWSIAIDRREQIGRASCRERVCRYV